MKLLVEKTGYLTSLQMFKSSKCRNALLKKYLLCKDVEFIKAVGDLTAKKTLCEIYCRLTPPLHGYCYFSCCTVLLKVDVNDMLPLHV